jgi:hypothetical protein
MIEQPTTKMLNLTKPTLQLGWHKAAKEDSKSHFIPSGIALHPPATWAPSLGDSSTHGGHFGARLTPVHSWFDELMSDPVFVLNGKLQ